MQRSESGSSIRSHGAHEPAAAQAVTPPWEQRRVAQVPYMRANSPPLTESERAALPSLWASHQSSDSQQHQLGSHVRAGKATNYGPSPVFPARDERSWTGNQPISHAPISARLPPLPQMPYESVRIPNAPKTAPIFPSFVSAPPSPPQSLNLSRSSTTSGGSRARTVSPPMPAASAPPALPPLPALPGTMSTRERSESHGRSRSSRRAKSSHAKTASADTVSFGQRFKAGFKNMFKRDSIDESQFEHISDRHWTDD